MPRGDVLLGAFVLVAGFGILNRRPEPTPPVTFTRAAGATLEAAGDGRIVHLDPVVVVIVVLLALLVAVGLALHIKVHWQPGGSIKDLFS